MLLKSINKSIIKDIQKIRGDLNWHSHNQFEDWGRGSGFENLGVVTILGPKNSTDRGTLHRIDGIIYGRNWDLLDEGLLNLEETV